MTGSRPVSLFINSSIYLVLIFGHRFEFPNVLARFETLVSTWASGRRLS